MSFSNPVVGGGGELAIDNIHSRGFVTGTTGWIIRKNGTAEFNTLGGVIQITASGLFFYSPTAASGNLKFSLTTADGTDQYGNSYHAGLFINQLQSWNTGDGSDTVVINANGASGPQILFTVAGNSSMAEIIGDQAGGRNQLLIEATGGSGTKLNINMPFQVTGGITAVSTAAGAQPPFNVTGSYVKYLSASWFPVSVICPPSETIRVTTTIQGHNNNTVNANVAVQPTVEDVTAGATLLTPSTATGMGPHIVCRSTTDTQDLTASVTFTVGQDVLSGRAGHTIKFTPTWRISSGTSADASVGYGRMAATPESYSQPTSG